MSLPLDIYIESLYIRVVEKYEQPAIFFFELGLIVCYESICVYGRMVFLLYDGTSVLFSFAVCHGGRGAGCLGQETCVC